MDIRALWQRLISRDRVGKGWVRGKTREGDRILDAPSVAYAESLTRAPSQADLDAVFARASSAKVIRGGFHAEDAELLQPLLEIRDVPEVTSLAATLQLTGKPDGHCMCLGDPVLVLFDADGERLARLSIHHGLSLRWWGAWPADARLLDGRPFVEWLASRGVRGPLEQFELEHQQRDAAFAAWELWHEATPMPLRQYLTPYRDSLGGIRLVPPAGAYSAKGVTPPLPEGMTEKYFTLLAEMFEATMPDPVDRTRSLFGWLGRGSARWSAFPFHELVPIALLHRIATQDLINSVDGGEEEESVLDGAARFFASFEFQALRAPELARMPDALRRRLATRTGGGQDADRVARVRAAFGEA